MNDDTPSLDQTPNTADRIGRRSFVGLLGGTAATIATAGVSTVAGAQSESDESDLEQVEIDYDAYEDPADVYRVFDVRSNAEPAFDSFDGERVFAHTFEGAQKTANTSYQFSDHGHEPFPEEVYSRIRFHPNGLTLEESGTLRFYWAGVKEGARSSGGDGAPTGNDGWTTALSMAHRGEHAHPDGYNFSIYRYHMDQPSSSGDTDRTGHQLWTDQWNEIECYQKLNTYQNGEANADGVLRFWVNGELAYEHETMRWVTEPEQGIERVGPVGYWYLSDQEGQTMYYDDHEIWIGGMPE